MTTIRQRAARHKGPLSLLATVASGDLLAGWWYASIQHIPVPDGVYYALGVTTTSGSSVSSGTGGTARLITALCQLLLIPLVGLAFTLFTSRISALLVKTHVEESEQRVKEHVAERFRHHCGEPETTETAGQGAAKPTGS